MTVTVQAKGFGKQGREKSPVLGSSNDAHRSRHFICTVIGIGGSYRDEPFLDFIAFCWFLEVPVRDGDAVACRETSASNDRERVPSGVVGSRARSLFGGGSRTRPEGS